MPHHVYLTYGIFLLCVCQCSGDLRGLSKAADLYLYITLFAGGEAALRDGKNHYPKEDLAVCSLHWRASLSNTVHLCCGLLVQI
jgi:hypothetical protein